MVTLTGDFSYWLKIWYAKDITDSEDSKIGFSTSTFGFRNIINEITQVVETSLSCID